MLVVEDDRETSETEVTTNVVVVGADLQDLVTRACSGVPVAEIKSCDIQSVQNVVASGWPFAIVIAEELYGFDAQEFEALARDVSAELIRVRAEDPSAEAELGARLLDAFRRRNG